MKVFAKEILMVVLWSDCMYTPYSWAYGMVTSRDHGKATEKASAKVSEKVNEKANEKDHAKENARATSRDHVKAHVMENVMANALLDHTVQSFERESCFQHKMDLSAELAVM